MTYYKQKYVPRKQIRILKGRPEEVHNSQKQLTNAEKDLSRRDNYLMLLEAIRDGEV